MGRSTYSAGIASCVPFLLVCRPVRGLASQQTLRDRPTYAQLPAASCGNKPDAHALPEVDPDVGSARTQPANRAAARPVAAASSDPGAYGRAALLGALGTRSPR